MKTHNVMDAALRVPPKHNSFFQPQTSGAGTIADTVAPVDSKSNAKLRLRKLYDIVNA
jgi:hypothetical protein